MADALAHTSTPDAVNGNAVDVTTVTTAAGTADRQCVSLGDPSTNTRAGIGANGLKVDGSGATQPVSAATLPLPSGASTGAKQDTGNTSLSSIDTKTPALGQALAAASVPVILPAATITTLTPPAAITGFALESGHLASLDTKAPALVTGRVPVDASGVTVPVSGTFFQATQPVSGTVTAAQATAASLNATVTQGPANATPWNENIAQIGGSAVTLGAKVSASSIPVVVASDQGAFNVQHGLTGATNVMKTGTLTSAAVTADQVVLTYTVTTGKTFYLQYLVMYGRLTAVSATASILGAISLESPAGTKLITIDDNNPTTSEIFQQVITFSEPQPIASATVIRVVVTPAATTSMLWRANFGGYEK